MILAVFFGTAGFICAAGVPVAGTFALLCATGILPDVRLGTILILMAVFALLRGILHYVEQTCNHYIAFKLLALIRDKVFFAFRRLSPAKLEGKGKGNLISLITSDIELLEVFYAHTISPAVIALLFCISACVFLGTYYRGFALLAAVAYVCVGIVIPVVVSKKGRSDGMQFRTKSGELSSFVLENLRGLSEIIQYGRGGDRLSKMNSLTDELLAYDGKMKRRAGISGGVTTAVILFFAALLLVWASVLYMRGTIDFAGVLIPVVAFMSSFGPVIALSNLGGTLQNTFASGNRVLDVLEEQPETEEIFNKPQVHFKNAGVEHIDFSYGTEAVLSDVSVKFPSHTIVGIVGKSGSGKSTFLKLLMRFWSVRTGVINISGVPVDEVNTSDLRDMESYVTQETDMFHDSIENNVKIAKPDASHEEVVTACRKASVHDFIMTLPEGYNTAVGELGDTLSGGEKQRLGLARAFLHDAPFLLLDEPTSSLDSLNEAIILKSVNDAREHQTIVLVSHRRSTMKITDTLYRLENGRMC